jgi:CRP-like cAMP-binding protein
MGSGESSGFNAREAKESGASRKLCVCDLNPNPRLTVANRPLQFLHPGERTNPSGKAVSNRVLLSIPDNEYRLLRPALEFEDLPHHVNLHQPHEAQEFAHFLNKGLVSLVIVLNGGKSVEAGLVGNEGFIGIPGIAGLIRSPFLEVVQISGDGFRVPVGVLREVVSSAPQLGRLLERHSVILGLQIAQTAACNRLHGVEQRLARWLLMAQDRIDSGVLPITHDFLATMLGTDRPSVSLAAGVLQRNQIIEYNRGSVKILNRSELERAACECYAVIRQYSDAGELAPQMSHS